MAKRIMHRVFEQDGKKVKQCSWCNEAKEVGSFYASSSSPSGLTSRCKPCFNDKIKERMLTPEGREVRRKREARDKEKIRIARNEQGTRRREKRKDDIVWIEKQRETKRKSAMKHKEKRSIRQKEKLTEPARKMIHSQRVAIRHMLHNEIKSDKTVDLLGCTPDEFKMYIEKQFVEGMTWDNHGKGEDKWQIDHVLCAEVFDLSRESHQRVCFHHTNLRPLWMRDNILKSDRLTDGRMARNLSSEEKKEYLIGLGYGYLFDVTDPNST